MTHSTEHKHDSRTPRATYQDVLDAPEHRVAAGDTDTMWLAISTARARNDARRAEYEGVPANGRIDGVRAVLTGHTIVADPATTENVWHIDTGAGFPNGRRLLVWSCAPARTPCCRVRGGDC